MPMQRRRTATINNPPTELKPGQLAVEMANDPIRFWVGVPEEIDPYGRREIVETIIKQPGWRLFTGSGVYEPSYPGIAWCWCILKGGGGGGGHGSLTQWQAGGGGGEGGTIWYFAQASDLIGRTVTIGGGGIAYTSTYDSTGTQGGTTAIVGLCSVEGGYGGVRGSSGGTGGRGGIASTGAALVLPGGPGWSGGNVWGAAVGLAAYGGGQGGSWSVPETNSGGGGAGGEAYRMAPRSGAAGFALFIEF